MALSIIPYSLVFRYNNMLYFQKNIPKSTTLKGIWACLIKSYCQTDMEVHVNPSIATVV